MPKVAVVTDALSAKFYFPLWHQYYSSQVGSENIYLFSYMGYDKDFYAYKLGDLLLLDSIYNDDLRLRKITDMVNILLRDYDFVIRVDTDEFLVADPRQYQNLSDYIAHTQTTHVTSMGYDVIQLVGEPPLTLEKNILHQRRHGFRLTQLNKTCLTRVPLHWGRGFHYCSLYPAFANLYLFHLKRADILLQKEWNSHMRCVAADDDFARKYYSIPDSFIDSFHADRSSKKLHTGWEGLRGTTFYSSFFSAIQKNSQGIFDGPYVMDDDNVQFPEEFTKCL